MQGDFSRVTFDRRKHYRGVNVQQGRVLTDADFNEAEAIAHYLDATTHTDLIGPAGAPRNTAGFALGLDTSGALNIGAGHFYVDGLLAENEAEVRYDAQPDLPNPPALTSLLAAANVGLAYLDVFPQHITFRDDPAIHDPALHNSDPTTRERTVWQVRVLPLPSVTLNATQRDSLIAAVADVRTARATLTATLLGGTDAQIADARRSLRAAQRELTRRAESFGIGCQQPYAEWDQLTTPTTARLEVRTAPTPPANIPCEVPPGGGFLRGENQFYRVEVQSVGVNGARAGATFKWSRENGAVIGAITAVGTTTSGSASGTTARVDSAGRDANLSIKVNDWVEYVDDASVLNGLAGPLARVTKIIGNDLTLDTSVTVDFARHPQLRRWDQSGSTATATGVAMNNSDATWIDLEDGVQVRFTGSFRVGDYWHFAARAETATLDFPTTPQPPAGVPHHRARLGFVLLQATGQTSVLHLLQDCRPIFPPLTAISARDVSFDNTTCALDEATNVQEAIDLLCQRSCGGGDCTFTVSPGEEWFTVFDRIADGQDAKICFTVGDFFVSKPLTIARKGHLVLTGAGRGTRIRALEAESALTFDRCASVTVRDLAVESGLAREGEGVNGALTFSNCVTTTLDTVALRCPSGPVRSASCLTVQHDTKHADLQALRGLVEVRNCTFLVGSGQIGALVVNGARITFDNNTFACHQSRRNDFRLAQGIRNAGVLAEVRRLLLNDIRPERPTLRDPRLRAVETHPAVTTIIEGTVQVLVKEFLGRGLAYETLVQFDAVRPLVTRAIRDSVEAVRRRGQVGNLDLDEVAQRLSAPPFLHAFQAEVLDEVTWTSHRFSETISLAFRSDPRLVQDNFWPEALRLLPGRQIRSRRQAEAHLISVANSFLERPAMLDRFAEWLKGLQEHDEAALYQAVTVGGETVAEVRLLNNTVSDAVQGLHIGLSRRGAPHEERLKAQTVTIEGNTITSLVPPTVTREAYGIYVGNCASLLVANNVLTQRPADTAWFRQEGIHLAGAFGKRLLVRQNECADFRYGIYVAPEPPAQPPLWRVVENVATVVTTTAQVQESDNVV